MFQDIHPDFNMQNKPKLTDTQKDVRREQPASRPKSNVTEEYTLYIFERINKVNHGAEFDRIISSICAAENGDSLENIRPRVVHNIQ